MKDDALRRFRTGLALPVSCLRGPKSCGIGDFADLSALASSLGAMRLDVLQLLPLQDTGRDASPYAAISTRALHPIYLSLDDLPGAGAQTEALTTLRRRLESNSGVDYAHVHSAKRELARAIHDGSGAAPPPDEWMRANAWVRGYAAFRVLLRAHDGRPWWEWGEDLLPEALVELAWAELGPDCTHEAWLQFHCDRQLLAARAALRAHGVLLKGDLPILMQEQSVEVWMNPELFDRERRAGAPPDMFTHYGQNWQFPVYRWERHEADGMRWWNDRLAHAARYYDAIRLDHILGFFRIWQVPLGEITGALGQFYPALPIRREELRAAGFDDETVDRLTRPSGSEEPEQGKEARLFEIEDPELRERELERYWDRPLLRSDSVPEGFRPLWRYRETAQFAGLPENLRDALTGIVQSDESRQLDAWDEAGTRRLGAMAQASEMLLCGEDLGEVPACVPDALRRIGILGLRLDRWLADASGEYLEPASHPREVVFAAGTHDLPSLRGWWKAAEQEVRSSYAEAAGIAAGLADLDPNSLLRVHERLLVSNACLVMLCVQDLLALDEALRPLDPDDERINIPGTPPWDNWRYRMPVSIDEWAAADAPWYGLGPAITQRRERSAG